MTHRKLITQMLDCIDELKYSNDTLTAQRKSTEAVAAAREYLAQPEQSYPKEGVIVKEAVFGLYDNDYLCYHVVSAGPANVEFTFDKQTRELISARAVGYYATPQPKAPEPLTDEEIRAEFAKLYPNDIGILELAENNRDYALEAIGARHHWAAFLAGARVVLAAQRSKT